jgi:hypothetical protein
MGELSGDLGKIGLVRPYWRIHAGNGIAAYAATQRPCISIKIITLEHYLADARNSRSSLPYCRPDGVLITRNSMGRAINNIYFINL